ncbi:MAG: OpgC family protein [Gammaproteobacteria bacterium]
MTQTLSQRDQRLDALRGFLLVIMLTCHLGTPLANFAASPFGFATSAEGFILLSGFVAALVYGKRFIREGYLAMRRRVWRRTGQVYLCHLGLLLGGVLLVGLLGPSDAGPVSMIFDDWHAERASAVVLSSVLLLFQPAFFDILPIYVIGLFPTPLILRVGRERGWWVVLGASLVLWVAAQFGIKHGFEQWARTFGPVALGSFDIFAWQLLWVSGLCLGSLHLEHGQSARTWRITPLALGVAVVVAIFFFGLRHGFLSIPSLTETGAMLNKWTLGPLRLLNIACLIALLIAFAPQSLPRFVGAPLALLGRYSLPTFCFHIPLALVGKEILYVYKPDALTATTMGLAAIALLFLPAWFSERRARAELRPSGAL